ncbi:MAG TPA: CsgG/HfaB family protein [Gemmatimonadaceae bacterium]|jgi:TolB-like protein
MKRFGASILIAAAALLCVAPVTRAQNAPVVTVLAFDNAAFGPGAKDYDGIGKGITDLLILDLASNGKVRVVDRERIQNILDEQKLSSSGAVDGTTAVRVGKLLGACYSIYGSFMRDQRTGNNTITLHTTSNETGQIGNGQKIESKGDDIMGLIAQASAKFISMMDVKACPGGMSRSSSAEPAQQGGAKTAPGAAEPQKFANALPPEQVKKLEAVKIDARTMLLYSRALDAKDHKDKAKAIELLKQVVAKVPNFDQANAMLASLSKAGD